MLCEIKTSTLTLCQQCIVRYTVTVLLYKHTVIAASLIGIGIIGTGLIEGKVEVSANRGESVQESDLLKAVPSVDFLSAVVEKVLSAKTLSPRQKMRMALLLKIWMKSQR